MKQRVTIARKTSGYDSYGQPVYSAGVVYQAAVVGEMKKILKANGEEVVSKQQCYLMSNAGMTPEDRITLSTEDVASTEKWAVQPEILSVRRYPFLQGQFCVEIDL